MREDTAQYCLQQAQASKMWSLIYVLVVHSIAQTTNSYLNDEDIIKEISTYSLLIRLFETLLWRLDTLKLARIMLNGSSSVPVVIAY